MEPLSESENSFEKYKNYLEQSIGVQSIKLPNQPINPYMRFFLQRSAAQRKKGTIYWPQLSKNIAEQWKKLSEKDKQFYQASYNLKIAERDRLVEQYHKLTKKPQTAYTQFFKRKFKTYSSQLKGLSSSEISKMCSNDWKLVTKREKDRLNQNYERQLASYQLNKKDHEFYQNYMNKVEQYNIDIKQQKEKLQKKYGISKEEKKLDKKKQREIARKSRTEQKRLLDKQRKAVLRKQKQQEISKRKKKLYQQQQRQRAAKRQKLQKQKHKQQAKIDQRKNKAKDAKEAKEALMKKQQELKIKKLKAKVQVKAQANSSKVQRVTAKTKIIKKAKTVKNSKGNKNTKKKLTKKKPIPKPKNQKPKRTRR